MYRVDSPVPLSETHHGPDGLTDKPHGLTRCVSLKVPTLGMSEVRFCWSGSLGSCGQTKKRGRYQHGQGTQEQPSGGLGVGWTCEVSIVPPSISEFENLLPATWSLL